MTESELKIIIETTYSLPVTSLDFLQQSGGASYLVVSGAEKYLLKVIGNAFQDSVRQSTHVMNYLSERKFPVPRVIKTTDMQLFHEVSGQALTLTEYLEGEEPDIQVHAEAIGRLVGQFHKLMDEYSESLVSRDEAFFTTRYIDILKKKHYDRIDVYSSLANSLWSKVSSQPVANCHGDLHRGNLLLAPDNQLYLLDFDTCCQAPRMFDVMVMCDTTNYFDLQPDDYKNATEVFERFLSGYGEYITLSESEIASFYDWISLRHFQLQATIVALYGLECIDNRFIDAQLQWLQTWQELHGGSKI